MDSFDILVIILSVTLAILLILCIVLVINLIKLSKSVQNITAKAEDIMDDVESVSSFFKNAAPKVAVTSLISNIVSKVTESRKGK